jgi:capsular exopolysaccharide synthesis family protein
LGSNNSPGFSRNGHLSPAPAFDQLSARLLLFDIQPKSATFLITSPEPGSGKSTVAANLAVSLAQGGNKVVLIDMDFHRPRQHSIFGLQNELGLSNFFSDEIQLQRILQKTTHQTLSVITAGSSQNVPNNWLTPEKIGSLFQSLVAVFDYVLIDAPALLSVADPMVLASQADAVILVVARRKTERKNFRFALQQLTEIKANIAGIVVNKIPNSQLYSYYSKQRNNQVPLLNEKSADRIADEGISIAAGLDKK